MQVAVYFCINSGSLDQYLTLLIFMKCMTCKWEQDRDLMVSSAAHCKVHLNSAREKFKS